MSWNTKQSPWTLWTMEYYDEEKAGIRGAGGLGTLAADFVRTARDKGEPFVVVTPFYPVQVAQTCTDDGQINYANEQVDWQEHHYLHIGEVDVWCDGRRELTVLQKFLGSARLICVTEPNLGELYVDTPWCDQRLYQEVVLGFGGTKALELAGVEPAILHLSEGATSFAALAKLDRLVAGGMDLDAALAQVRSCTGYMNHTLHPSGDAHFTRAQCERYVFPNLQAPAVKDWLISQFCDDHVCLSALAIELADMRIAVSKMHASLAEVNYHDRQGEPVGFAPITNGINLPRWVMRETLDWYRCLKILDEFCAPVENCESYLESTRCLFKPEQVSLLKGIGRAKLQAVLAERVNQSGESVTIPNRALVFTFKHHGISYKRFRLLFAEPERLRGILKKKDAYLLIGGKGHPGDDNLTEELNNILQLVENDPVFRERVHFLPDYDEELAKALSFGGNVSINLPTTGEACGTGWMKDVVNLNLLISTPNGGVADKDYGYLRVEGANEAEEASSLYDCLEWAADLWRGQSVLAGLQVSVCDQLRKQLATYLPTISSVRMFEEYKRFFGEHLGQNEPEN